MSRSVSSWGSQEPSHLSIPIPEQIADRYRKHTALAPRLKLYNGQCFTTFAKFLLVYSLQDGRLLHVFEEHELITYLDVHGDVLVVALTDGTIRIRDLISGDGLELGRAFMSTNAFDDLVEYDAFESVFALDDDFSSVGGNSLVNDYYDESPEGEAKLEAQYESMFFNEADDNFIRNVFVFILKPQPFDTKHDDTVSGQNEPAEPLIIAGNVSSPGLRVWKLPSAEEWKLSPQENTRHNARAGSYDLETHGHIISCFAARGRTILTGGRDCTARTWDVVTRECEYVFLGHTDEIWFVALDERQAYTSSRDGTVRIWNFETGNCAYVFRIGAPSRTQQPSIKLWSTHLIASDRLEKKIWAWNISSGELDYQLTDISESVWQHDSCKLLVAHDATLDILDIQSRKLLKRLSFADQDHPRNVILNFRFRGRYCVALEYRDKRPWLHIWDFGDDDGWLEKEENPNDANDRMRFSVLDRWPTA